MKNFTSIKKLFFLLLGLWAGNTFGQENCSGLLILANKAYNQGKYEKVIALLQPKNSDCQFNKVENEQATKLLASALYYIDEVEEAEKYVFQLLEKHPTYEVQTTVDPLPFVTILDKFECSPRNVIGFYIGSSSPFIKTIKSYSVLNTSEYTSKYTPQSTASFSLYYQHFLKQKFSIALEPEITQLKFNREIDVPNKVAINYNERSYSLKIPITIGYELYRRNHYSASLSTGIYGCYNWNHEYDINYQLPNEELIESSGELNSQRNNKNFGYQIGLNLAYTKNRLRFSAKLDYSADFKQYNNSQNRYDANNSLLDYYYVDDDIRIRKLDLKLGIAYTFSYKVKHKYNSK